MPTLIIEHSDSARSARLGVLLRDQGHRFQTCRIHHGETVPSSLEGIDGIVVLGGAADPDSDDAAIMGELELLRQAHAAALPILGICLGSQLLCRALGGEIAKLDGPIEAGWHDVDLTPTGREDPLFTGIPWTSKQIHWHRWHASKLPADARVLASSERTPVQAWSLGLRTYGIQYHPEADGQALLRWADEDAAALSEAGINRADLEAGNTEHDAVHDRLATRLFERVAMVLMPVDRRFAGTMHE